MDLLVVYKLGIKSLNVFGKKTLSSCNIISSLFDWPILLEAVNYMKPDQFVEPLTQVI